MVVNKNKASNKLVDLLLASDFHTSPFYDGYRQFNGSLILEHIKENFSFYDLDANELDYYLVLLKTILNEVQPQDNYSWTDHEIKVGDMYAVYENARENYKTVYDATQKLREQMKEV